MFRSCSVCLSEHEEFYNDHKIAPLSRRETPKNIICLISIKYNTSLATALKIQRYNKIEFSSFSIEEVSLQISFLVGKKNQHRSG